jgi:hypothetical protein
MRLTRNTEKRKVIANGTMYEWKRKDHVPSREITRGAVNRLEATIYVAQGEVKDFPRYLETALHFDIKYIYLIRRVQVNDK